MPSPLATKINSRALSLTAELRALDEEERTVELSFSSEAEVERWYGIEILGHSPGEVRLERLNNSAPFLMDHNRRDQVGVVIEGSAVIGSDKKGRCKVKLSRSQRGEEIFQDVKDEIRKNCSIHYLIHEAKVVGERNDVQIIRVVDWEPTEVSLVSVPADDSVGVGRSQEDDDNMQNPENENNKTQENEGARNEPQKSTIDLAAEREKTRKAEQERVRTLIALGDQFEERELADQYVGEERSVDEFNKVLLEKLGKSRGEGVQESSVGMSESETKEYSFVRAIRALVDPTNRRAQEAATFEMECSRAAADKMGREVKGFVVPYDVLSRGLLNVGAPEAGGYTVDTTLLTSSFIELLRKKAIAMQLATSLSGLVGNVGIPGQTSGASGYWVGEDEAVGEGEPAFSNITLSPKTVGAFSEITRKLLSQSSMDVEALVRADLAKALALTIDRAAFYGEGTDDSPRGIISTVGINAVTFADVNPTYAELVGMESEISADDADVNNMCYIGNTRFRGHCKTAEKFAGTSGATIWEKGNMVNGYLARVTNQINNGDVLFGNFSDLIVGLWGGLELTTDPYTHSTKGRLRIVAMQDVDFAVRHVESFCLGKKVAG